MARADPNAGGPASEAPSSQHGGDSQQTQVEGLLRSGKPALSVSESKRVADFLARQKDLLILCAGPGDTWGNAKRP